MPNRLADSKSPYLLQHKDNPVDWYEWGPEAFEAAKARDVPVLLSVGYSACHWCHVMAHESFEDPDTAEVMNERFVNIKVDREERPDVDSIYMEAVQAMTGRGGWPMTVFMTPDKEPFFAGTYFPKQTQHGMANFSQVMDAVSQAWSADREKVLAQAEQLVAAVAREVPAGDPISEETLQNAYRSIEGQFDATFGGFGGAPKFPQQPVLDFLLRVRESHPGADNMLATTLARMADGGIHDQLGGGFARYSVDHRWVVPHFEKMLYDNGQLARIYLWAGIELGSERFLDVARSTLDYLLSDLRHAEGGFFSAEDADSEGEEGTFYVWTPDEFEQILGDDAGAAAAYYGVTQQGNFEGKNILTLSPDRPEPGNIDSIDIALLTYRNQRVRPGLDDKVIASWNGLAIRSFAEAGAALNEPKYLDAARAAATFINANMIRSGRVSRSWKDGEVSGPGFIDDHAGLAIGLLTLYAATGEVEWFEISQRLVGSFDRFTKEKGGFYTTSVDAEELIKRPDDMMDNPLPSGNALAAEALLISSLLTGDLEMRSAAVEALSSAGLLAQRYPSMVAHHLSVAASMANGTKELAIVGPDREEMTSAYWSAYRPGIALAQSPSADPFVPLLDERRAPDNGSLAYVCRDFVCDLPTDSTEKMLEQLEA